MNEKIKYISMYLGAIVLANLSTSYFGASASVVNAFLFIGLDLTSRDKLHESWGKNGFVWKMSALILVGSLISYILNRNAGTIALASFVAFACAAIIDTVVYQILKNKSYMIKVNGSNVFGSLADSIIFPTIAFGGFSILITILQFLSKMAGGFVWSYILKNKKYE
jgi:hypothetical protein